MADEVDNPGTEEVLQEPATETPTEETPPPEAESEETTEEGNAEPDVEETEFDGETYKVPKKLAAVLADVESYKKGFQADATRKTMEAAELRKSAEAFQAELQQEAETNRELFGELSQLHAIDSELSQYQKVDWQAWQVQNAQAANAAMARYMQLTNSRNNLVGHVEGRKQELATLRQQQAEKAMGQAVERLSKPDPDKGWDGNFNDAKRDTLGTFARELGYSEEQIARTIDPLNIKTLNLARIGLEALKKSRAATAKPQIAPTVEARPVPELSKGKGNLIKGLSDRLSTEEWVKRRNAQVYGNGAKLR